MAKLTADQVAFLHSQNIDPADVFDGTGMRQKDWRAKARAVGKRYAFGVSRCAEGHTLRSRSGHCIQCDTSQIAFGGRHAATARLYVMGSLSGRCMKIGISNDDLDHRLANIRSQTYGGFGDWKILAITEPLENAGAIEHEAQTPIAIYRIEGSSNRAGKVQASQEMFACSFSVARKALADVLPAKAILALRVTAAEVAQYEWKRAA